MWRAVFLAVSIVSMIGADGRASAEEVLNNNSVVTMLQAGLGPDTVVAKVKASVSTFDTSTAALIDLKHKGVPDSVIAAMVDAASRPSVSASALANSSSIDPKAPHASGVYILADWLTPAKMVRIDVASSNQTKTGGFLGYALTGGIAKMKFNTVLPAEHARVATQLKRPVFFFYFDQASASLSQSSGFWLAGPAAPITSPNEFSLIKFDVKKGRREAAVGQFNIGGAKAGVQDNQRITFVYDSVAPGVYRVMPDHDLVPGEYGFIYSTSNGGGVGLAGMGATMSRIFDFSIGS